MYRRAVICTVIIAAGLALRGFGLGLGIPAMVVKYGGSALWSAMLFFIVALAARHSARLALVMATMLIAIVVELIRLYHTPWLDSFRLTLAGALLLGRIFSLWNIVAYAGGIVVAAWFDKVLTARTDHSS